MLHVSAHNSFCLLIAVLGIQANSPNNYLLGDPILETFLKSLSFEKAFLI